MRKNAHPYAPRLMQPRRTQGMGAGAIRVP